MMLLSGIVHENIDTCMSTFRACSSC